MCSGCVLNGGKQKLGSLSLREREREREREGEGEGGRDVCSGCVLNGGKQKLGDGEPTCEHSGVRVRVVATDARSASVAGHVVRSSIILQPGGRGSASVTAATSHESLDMDANDTQGPWSCSPRRVHAFTLRQGVAE